MHVFLIGTLGAVAGFIAGVVFSSVVLLSIHREVAALRGEVKQLAATASADVTELKSKALELEQKIASRL